MKAAERIRFISATGLFVLFSASWLLFYRLWSGAEFNSIVVLLRQRASFACTVRCLGVLAFVPFLIESIKLLLLGLLSVALLTALAKARRRMNRTKRYIRSVEKRVIRQAPLIPGLSSVKVFDDPNALAFTAGFLRPKIYLSHSLLKNLDKSELRAVVLHESHHLRKRDPLKSLLTSFLADFLFFFPIVHFLKKSCVLTSEIKADSYCAARGAAPLDIASALLKAQKVRSVNVAWFFDQNQERIKILLGRPFKIAPALSKIIFSSVLLVALTFVSLVPIKKGATAVVLNHENLCSVQRVNS